MSFENENIYLVQLKRL